MATNLKVRDPVSPRAERAILSVTSASNTSNSEGHASCGSRRNFKFPLPLYVISKVTASFVETLSADRVWVTFKLEKVPTEFLGAASGKGRTSMVTGSQVAWTSRPSKKLMRR